jgi:hypothetical protein
MTFPMSVIWPKGRIKNWIELNIFLSFVTSDTFNYVFCNVRYQISHPYKIINNILVLYVLIVKFSDRWECKSFLILFVNVILICCCSPNIWTLLQFLRFYWLFLSYDSNCVLLFLVSQLAIIAQWQLQIVCGTHSLQSGYLCKESI